MECPRAFEPALERDEFRLKRRGSFSLAPLAGRGDLEAGTDSTKSHHALAGDPAPAALMTARLWRKARGWSDQASLFFGGFLADGFSAACRIDLA
jgi:hypothetical protein